MKWTFSGSFGCIWAMTEPLTEPTSETMAPGFSAGAMASAAAPEAPTGTQTMTQSASLAASAGRGMVGIAEAECLGPFQRVGRTAVDRDMADELVTAGGERDRGADQTDADKGEAREYRLFHAGHATLDWDRNSRSAAIVASLASALPTVMRKASGRP